MIKFLHHKFSHLQNVFHFNRFTVPSLLPNNCKTKYEKAFSSSSCFHCICFIFVCVWVFLWRGKNFKFNVKWRWWWCQACASMCAFERIFILQNIKKNFMYTHGKSWMMIKFNWRNFLRAISLEPKHNTCDPFFCFDFACV